MALLTVLLPAPWASGDGRIDYILHCQGCHLPNGAGTPGAVPALRDSVARFLDVPGGREYLIRVPGSADAPIDDAALAAVLNWMLETFGPAEAASRHPEFGAAEVAASRSRPLLDAEATRAGLLARMPPRDLER